MLLLVSSAFFLLKLDQSDYFVRELFAGLADMVTARCIARLDVRLIYEPLKVKSEMLAGAAPIPVVGVNLDKVLDSIARFAAYVISKRIVIPNGAHWDYFGGNVPRLRAYSM